MEVMPQAPLHRQVVAFVGVRIALAGTLYRHRTAFSAVRIALALHKRDFAAVLVELSHP